MIFQLFINVCSIAQCPRRKCDFGSSLRDDEVIEFSIDGVIVEETQSYPLVGEVNERSVVSGMEVTKK